MVRCEQGDVSALSDEELQRLLDRVVADYAGRVEARVESGGRVPEPFPAERTVTATAVVIAARQMLAAFGLSPFELSLLSRF